MSHGSCNNLNLIIANPRKGNGIPSKILTQKFNNSSTLMSYVLTIHTRILTVLKRE